MKRLYRSLGQTCLWLCLVQPGLATAATYVVISMIGSQLTVVTAQQQTGSNLDRNFYDVRPLKDPILDTTALTVTKAAVEKARPGSSVVTLRLSDPELLASQEKWFDKATFDAPELLELVKTEIGDDPANRLILICSWRTELELMKDHGYMGSGKAAGVGFYMDRFIRMQRSDTGEKAQGMLAPFANLRIALIDPRTLAIESLQPIAVGVTRSAARAEDRDPWNVMSGQEKIRALQMLVAEEIARAIPKILGAQSR